MTAYFVRLQGDGIMGLENPGEPTLRAEKNRPDVEKEKGEGSPAWGIGRASEKEIIASGVRGEVLETYYREKEKETGGPVSSVC